MNECKSTADIVELMSRIVIVVDCSAEGQKRSGQLQLTAKEKRNKQRKYQEKYDRIYIFA